MGQSQRARCEPHGGTPTAAGLSGFNLDLDLGRGVGRRASAGPELGNRGDLLAGADGLGFSFPVLMGPDHVLTPVNVGSPSPTEVARLRRSLGKGSCFPSAVS